MKYYTFKPQFHKHIINGRKFSTIRQKTKVMPGERFALRYWSGRPYASKMGYLGTAVCTSFDTIFIDHDSGITEIRYGLGNSISQKDAVRLSLQEGFFGLDDMMRYFNDNHGFPVSGIITLWDHKTFIPGPPNNVMDCSRPIAAIDGKGET